ncbi:glycosyltransferase family 4 protein [Eubacterium sp.]
MKITLLLRYFTIGGLERVVSSLANGYVKDGHDVQIIVLSKGKRNSLITEIDPKVKVIFLNGGIIHKISEIRRLTEGRIVHIHFGDGKIHPIIRMGLLNRKIVITCHSVYSHKRNILLNNVDRLFSLQAKKIVAVSDAVREFCANEVKIADNKVCVIKNGIERNGEKISIKKKNTLNIVSLASLYPHKNHIYLIRALAELKKQQEIPFKLYMIGDGPCMAELYLEAVALGLGDNIVWYGAVWQKKLVRDIIKKSDVFVSASKYEGFPISILEGMIYGLPMILSSIPPHREMIGNNGLFFDFDEDYHTFIDSFVKFYNDVEVRESMSESSYKMVEKYDMIKTIDSYIKVYEEVV